MFTKSVIGLSVLALVLAAVAPASATADGWRWPVAGEIVTPYRNVADPYAGGQHRGIDIAAPLGSAVSAATSGIVTFAGRLPDSGICATVRTSDGRYLLSYLHLASRTVTKGEFVGAGAAIGTVGVTGTRSIATPHLHFSARLEGTGAYVDPSPLLGPRPVAQPAPAANVPPQPAQSLVEAPRVSVPRATESPVAQRPALPRANGRADRLHSPGRHRSSGRHDRASGRVVHGRPVPMMARGGGSAARSSAVRPVARRAPTARPSPSVLSVPHTTVASATAGDSKHGSVENAPNRLPQTLLFAVTVLCLLTLAMRARRQAQRTGPALPPAAGAARAEDEPTPGNVSVLPR